MVSASQAFNRITSLNNEEEEDTFSIPTDFRQDYGEILNPRPQISVIPQESIEEYHNILKPEEGTHRTSLGVEYTLNDLEKSPEFQTRAARFIFSSIFPFANLK